MILWSIQGIGAWEKALKTGILKSDKRFVPKYWVIPYQWMRLQMNDRLGTKEIGYPLWGWYQYQNSKERKPDLRSNNYMEPGSRAVRLTIDIDDKKVILSDFEKWHWCLNNWYLGSDKNLQKIEKIYKDNLTLIQAEKMRSWKKIFKIKPDKPTQATFWPISIECVKEVTPFICR